MKKDQLWTKEFIIVSLINFLLSSVFYLLIVIIAVYAVSEYDASSSEAGLVSGIFIIGALIGRFFIGKNIDIIGWRRTLFIGIISFIIMTLLYFVSFHIISLIFVRLLHGIALGVASTATGTIVSHIIPAKRKGEGIGYYSMSATLAGALGPFLGIYLSQNASYDMIFGFCVFLGLVGLMTAFFVKEQQPDTPDDVEVVKGFKLSQFVEPKALPIAVVVLIVAFCYSSVLSYISLYAEVIDLVKAASFFFLIYSLAILISRPFTGKLLDIRGANYVMYPAFVLFTIGMLILSVASTSFLLLLSAVFIGLGFGNMQSCTQAIAVKLTPPHRLGLATSTFYIFLDAGLGFGPYILGFIIPLLGYQALYATLAAVVLASTGVYYVLYGKKERERGFA